MTSAHFGPYQVRGELGSGSLSTVYRAEHEALGRVVAIKALRPTIAPTSPFAAQLEREARVLAALNHPNVVQLHELVKSAQALYLVLEYVDGFSLAAVLGKRARFAPDFVAAIGLEVARGLAHAHERGVVHRDVKPANVLLSRRGEVKLVDFGIAQRGEGEAAPSGQAPRRSEAESAFGTPAYMSPEQILGEAVDARSDVFSLGVVLYQLLAGARPFDRDGEEGKRAAAQRIRRDPARPLRERAPDVPRAIERVVMRCLEKLPADRYASCEEVAERLDAYLRGHGVTKPASLVIATLAAAGLTQGDADAPAPSRVAPPPRARPMARTLAGYAIVTLVFVLGGAWLQWSARGARAAAEAGSKPLELLPASAGALRVVTTPWAEVSVDGQRVDVTPMARAIPLAAGPHYVTLTHPRAPAEKRLVTIAAGETTTLDVTMDLADGGAPGDAGPLDLDAGALEARALGDAG
jgi:serine/threonine-protein kinase